MDKINHLEKKIDDHEYEFELYKKSMEMKDEFMNELGGAFDKED